MAMTNRQSHLADVVRGAVERFRRGSVEAHRAYLEAAAALVEARDGAKRGQWGPFIEAAGVDERTARNMMRLARAGVKPETVSAFGGVKAMLDWLKVTDRCQHAYAVANELEQHAQGIFTDGDGRIFPFHAALWITEMDPAGEGADTGAMVQDFVRVRDAHSQLCRALDHCVEAGTWNEALPPIGDRRALLWHELVAMVYRRAPGGKEATTFAEAEAVVVAEGRALMEKAA